MNIWGVWCGFLGALGVSIGAFAAHGLKSRLSEQALTWVEIGARYQMYHALALIAVAWVSTSNLGWLPKASGTLFLLGVLLFSGSLYVMALTDQRWLGAVTPLGGLCFIFGWLFLALSFR